MTITKVEAHKYYTRTDIKIYIGDHTYSSHSFREYEKNAVQSYFAEVKKLAREVQATVSPKLVIGRGHTSSDIHRINFELETEYKRSIEEYKTIIGQFPYLEDHFVTMPQMQAFNHISNLYGRHGSNSYLKFAKIHNVMNHLDRLHDLLTDRPEGLLRIEI